MHYRFDDIRVDAAGFQVSKAGRAVELEPKSFRVLLFLIENRGRVIPKDELMQSVWNETFVTDNALTRVIAQLRKALGDDARLARYIETVPTVGYRFIADVIAPETVPPLPAPPPDRAHRWWLALPVGIVLLAVVGWRFLIAAPEARHDYRSVQVTASSGLDVQPDFSPDGSSIAYSTDRGGRFEIYVRPLAIDGREISVTADGGQNIQPVWSPDGKYIAYHSVARGGIYLVPALGGPPRQLTAFGSGPAWSPDGKSIAFRGERVYSLALPDLGPSGPSSIWLVSAIGGEPHQLTHDNSPAGRHSTPAWSPDGRRIVFFAHQSVGAAELWAVDIASGGLERIEAGRFLFLSVRFAPDGSGLYFAGYSQIGDSGVWFLPLTRGTVKPAGDARPITVSGSVFARDLSISADGRRLAYVSAMQSSNLLSLPLNPRTHVPAGAPRALTGDTSFRNSVPMFSPDGSRIAYFVRRRGIKGDIWVMDRDGSNAVPVTTHPTVDFLPNWSPDGKSLIYGSDRDGLHKLWMTRLDDRKDSVFGSRGPFKVRSKLSPDGSAAAYHRTEGSRSVLYRWDFATGQETRLSAPQDSLGFAAWSPDGKWIACERRRGDDTVLAILPSRGGPVEELTDVPGHAWVHSWSPDGKKLAYAGVADGAWNVYWVSRSTRERKQLTNLTSMASFVRYPAWSPQADAVVYEYSETKGNIFVVDLK